MEGRRHHGVRRVIDDEPDELFRDGGTADRMMTRLRPLRFGRIPPERSLERRPMSPAEWGLELPAPGCSPTPGPAPGRGICCAPGCIAQFAPRIDNASSQRTASFSPICSAAVMKRCATRIRHRNSDSSPSRERAPDIDGNAVARRSTATATIPLDGTLRPVFVNAIARSCESGLEAGPIGTPVTSPLGRSGGDSFRTRRVVRETRT